MTMEIQLQHVAAGCNRIVNALDWGESGLVAYGAHNVVIIYDPQASRVMATVVGHTAAVTCVHWFSAADFGLPRGACPAGESALASGSADGSVCIWWVSSGSQWPWRLAARLEGHSAPITSVAMHRGDGGGTTVLVSTAGDGDVLMWECSCEDPGGIGQDTWRLVQRLSFGVQLQLCAAMAELPGGGLLLSLGGVDACVRLLLRTPAAAGAAQDQPDSAPAEFRPVCELTGHQDWVRGVAFTQLDGRLLLASASQDKYIRLWAVAPEGAPASSNAGTMAALEDPAGVVALALTRYSRRPRFRASPQGPQFCASLEALLIGHEDWVHSVAWQPRAAVPDEGSGAKERPPCLLSASMDRTMTMWMPDAATGLWLSHESVGDAGANHLGYYTGVWGPGGIALLAHGFTGALHMWGRTDDGWEPQHSVGGHYGAVVDACWGAGERCLLTVGTDQTARITARLHTGRWCEIARPQVHGHDFSCVAALPIEPPSDGNGGSSSENGASGAAGSLGRERRYRYASGSEEKVLRVFESPRAFRDTLAMARGEAAAPLEPSAAGAYGAALPALGLSNKAVYSKAEAVGAGGGGPEAAYSEGPDVAPACTPSAVGGPPLEEHLAQNTLWPETHKLYGHGNEVYCLAADPRARFLASASKAQSAATAAVWFWDARKWSPAGSVGAHTLTVTQLAFSPDGRHLASASRDRLVAAYERCESPPEGCAATASGPPFKLIGKMKAHARIVWTLDWSPDSKLLATGSRDGCVKVWAAPEGGEVPAAPLCTLPMGDSVRSVAFATATVQQSEHGVRMYWVAAGLESGVICMLRLTWSPAPGEVSSVEVWRSSEFERHGAAVRRLCWQAEGEGSGGGQPLLLASCSDDHSVRIFACSL